MPTPAARAPRLAGLALAALGAFALAAVTAGSAAGQEPARPVFDIGLSQDTIAIGADFSGGRLAVFGVLEPAPALGQPRGRYDIVVVVEGPRRPVVVRRKDRVAGVWINRESQSFAAVPTSYLLASTRPLGDVAPERTLARLELGPERVVVKPADDATAEGRPFETALRRLRVASGVYSEATGAVTFVGTSLFRADLALPADLPVGQHTVHAYLFLEGKILQDRSIRLGVVKTGLEEVVHRFALGYGYLYGALAVVLAMLTGWLGRLMFARD
jgi:uncharacterized protein (TIGR02186 family)